MQVESLTLLHLFCCLVETADPEHGVQRGAAELLHPVDSLQHTTQLPQTTAQVHTRTHTHTALPFEPRRQACCLCRLCRSWFSSTGSEVSISSSNSSVDMGDASGGGGAVERWSMFGPRPLVQKSSSDLGSDPPGKRLTASFLTKQITL